MRIKRLLMLAVTAMGVVVSTAALAATPSEHYSKGDGLLKKGELFEALKAYADAIRSDRSNQQYVQQFMLVRQAYTLQDALEKETDSPRWLQYAQALRSFYVEQGVYPQALIWDKEIHQREGSAGSAVQLAEMQLALDKNSDAAQTLTAMESGKATTATRALLSVALARQGEMDRAREIAESIKVPEDSGPGTLYCVARANVAVGNKDQALVLLTRCFEATPPSRLDVLKSHAKKTPEFVPLASSARFSEVLATESKIAESKCSGGSSCAGCPMRGQCASSQGQ
jgi:tetratricopeptide (TPR) repeat protein